jgi:hypothetical protein
MPNKFEKQRISLAFTIRMYHDARSSECQIPGTKHTFTLKLDSNVCDSETQESFIILIESEHIKTLHIYLKGQACKMVPGDYKLAIQSRYLTNFSQLVSENATFGIKCLLVFEVLSFGRCYIS